MAKNGRQAGKPSKPEKAIGGNCHQMDANGCNCRQNKTKTKNKDKDKGTSPPIPPSGGRGEGDGPALEEGFRAFWQAYPRQIGKPEAQQEWAALCPDVALREVIQQAVRVHKQSAQWARDGGRYIPAPARWLKEKRWEDTPAPAQPHAGYDMEQLEELSVFSLPENL